MAIVRLSGLRLLTLTGEALIQAKLTGGLKIIGVPEVFEIPSLSDRREVIEFRKELRPIMRLREIEFPHGILDLCRVLVGKGYIKRTTYLAISCIWLVHKVPRSTEVIININADVHEVRIGFVGGTLGCVYHAN